MLDNLCNIGRLLRSDPQALLFFNPFMRQVQWAKDKKPPFADLPRTVLNLPLVQTSNGLSIDFKNLNFDEQQNADYRVWRVLYNPNAGGNALWLTGDIDNLAVLKDKSKTALSVPLAERFFPTGLFATVHANLDAIEQLLVEKENYLVHFVYPDGKHWYEQADVLSGFDAFLRAEMVKTKSAKGADYVVPKYNYLSCVNEDNNQAPGFNAENVYQNISFPANDGVEQALNFFWAQDFYSKTLMRLKGDYELRVLPDSTGLTANQLTLFYSDMDASNRLRIPDKLIANKLAENLLKPLKPGGLFKAAKVNIDPARKMTHVNFTATVFVATSTFTKKEVLSISNLSNSYLTHRLNEWQQLIADLQATPEWSEFKKPVDFVVWGENVWNKEEKRFTEFGAVQSLFIQERHVSLYPKLLYQLLMGNFAYDNLYRVFLEALYEQALKGGLSPKDTGAAMNVARQLKNSFLILTALQMKDSQSPISFTTRPSFKLGLALGKLLSFTRNEERFPNLYNRVYEVAGNIKRHVGNIDDVLLLVNDINSRMLRNHSKSDKHDTTYFRIVSQEVVEAIQGLDSLVADEVATGFYWQFLKPYEAKGAVKELVGKEESPIFESIPA